MESRQYLNIDGRPQDYKRIALAPGEYIVLRWPYVQINKPGIHNVAIGKYPPVTGIVGEDHFFPKEYRK